LPAAFLLAGWGILSIWRLLPEFGVRQLIWLGIGSLLIFGILRYGRDLDWLRRYRYLWLLGGLSLTALTLFLGTHPSGGEPKLWLGCCGLYFQPSEILRLLLIAYFASFLSDQLYRPEEQGSVSLTRVLPPLVVIWGVSIALLFVQRDLGTATLFLILFAILLYGISGRRIVLVLGALMVALAAAVAGLVLDVVRVRAVAWLAPWQDPIGAGYQIIQSLMALAGGGVFGQGIGLGSPGFIPAAHTDFIFSAIVEEWGFAGGLGMMGLLLLVIIRGLRLAGQRSRTFDIVLAGGLSTGLFLQSTLILAGVSRAIPLTGVTLPFVSYGGSSLITSFITLALLLQMSDRPRSAKPTPAWIQQIAAAAFVVFAILGLVLSWWTVVRAPALNQRADNPRRALVARYSPRGQILDRGEVILAETIGTAGSYVRHYPQDSASPLVGFDSSQYGQAGIEATMDPWLRGVNGVPWWQVWWKQTSTGSPPAGGDVRLSVQAQIQSQAMQHLDGHAGAIVVMEAYTGDLLAVASAPSFNSATVADNWGELLADPRSPMLNRPSQARYQPGTVLAPLLYGWSLAQEEGISRLDEGDMGRAVDVDGAILECARKPARQPVLDLGHALAHGCPAPWGDLAQILGAARLQRFQSEIGLDSLVSVALAQATDLPGAIDEEALFEYGIGQAQLTVSPLQLARAYSVLVNRGLMTSPHIVDAVRRPGEAWSAYGPEPDSAMIMEAGAADATVKALRQDSTLDYSAAAVSGEGNRRLAWHVGADLSHPARWLVLVVLEDGSPAQARALGLNLLEFVRRTLP
jgi:cell division protein FtsW (lipid II flippase)